MNIPFPFIFITLSVYFIHNIYVKSNKIMRFWDCFRFHQTTSLDLILIENLSRSLSTILVQRRNLSLWTKSLVINIKLKLKFVWNFVYETCFYLRFSRASQKNFIWGLNFFYSDRIFDRHINYPTMHIK